VPNGEDIAVPSESEIGRAFCVYVHDDGIATYFVKSSKFMTLG
jgi:hypothetical protein